MQENNRILRKDIIEQKRVSKVKDYIIDLLKKRNGLLSRCFKEKDNIVNQIAKTIYIVFKNYYKGAKKSL